LVTAVPFFSERPGSCPKTYHPAGIERGTATIKIHETRDNLWTCASISLDPPWRYLRVADHGL